MMEPSEGSLIFDYLNLLFFILITIIIFAFDSARYTLSHEMQYMLSNYLTFRVADREIIL